jgi:hypothetical protein
MKMTKTSIILEHIEITTGICGGKPRIAGHRIVKIRFHLDENVNSAIADKINE